MIKAIIKAPLVGFAFDRKDETQPNQKSGKPPKETGLLSVCINYRGEQRFYISTGNRILPSEWDAKKCEVNTKCLRHNIYNTMYWNFREKVQNIFDECQKKRKELTMATLK